jgi:hypothetical protein
MVARLILGGSVGNLWLVCAFRESARSMIQWTLRPAIAQSNPRSSNFFQVRLVGEDGDSGCKPYTYKTSPSLPTSLTLLYTLYTLYLQQDVLTHIPSHVYIRPLPVPQGPHGEVSH